jgi:transcriptional regulator with XRE-family HTH domain
MSPPAAELLRSARRRHRVSQRALARRSRTSQTHISRIERGEVSPSVETLDRLLKALGEQLKLSTAEGPRGNASIAELRADYERLTPGQRVLQAAELSRALTTIAAGRRS